jgi:hypothetical protein
MRRIGRLERARYAFDNAMSRGAGALLAWLFAASAALVIVTGIVSVVFRLAPDTEGGEPQGFGSAVWSALLHAIDAGTIAGDSGSRSYLALMLAITAAGVFFVSVFISLLTSGIQERLTQLRKGRSFVVEHEHILVLGWSAQITTVVRELAVAFDAEAQDRGEPSSRAIVVLAPRDKVEMEDELLPHLPSGTTVRLVCRTGSPLELDDLGIVHPEAARAVLILAPSGDDPDADVLKALLALRGGRFPLQDHCHIVAELRNEESVLPAKIAGGDRVEVVLVEDLISRIIVQTCRQSGLSTVYGELLDFDGDEIHLWPVARAGSSLVGCSFGDALLRFDRGTLLGIARQGVVTLGPAHDMLLEADDRAVVVARDVNDVVVRNSNHRVDESAFATEDREPSKPERTLVLGYNPRAHIMTAQLDAYVAPGSEVHVVAPVEGLASRLEAVASRASNLRVTTQEADTTSRAVLDALDVVAFDRVITLSCPVVAREGQAASVLSADRADARTLVTLLHLRDIAQKRGTKIPIVSEILEVKNRELAEVTRADDFIVSDRLVSLVLAQIAETRERAEIFRDLFDPEGVELYLRPIGEYLKSDVEVDFPTIVAAAARKGAVALGYRLLRHESDPDRSYGIKINPDRSARVRFEPRDKLIVLAEDG